jgi:hypothetical protein
MGVMAEDNGLKGRPAESLFALCPVHPALAWTEMAILKEGIGFLNPLGQFP